MRTLVARALALLLLIGIVYAATFGSAHSHISIPSQPDTNVDLNSHVQATLSTSGQVRAPHGAECLICLFHQQLYNSIVHDPFFIAKPTERVRFVLDPKFLNYSTSFTSTPIVLFSGRAPPLN